MFTLRFDMRAPDWAAPAAELYAAAIDMCAWAETRGAILAAVLSEHHGADDGHLPVPLILASAIAARTTRLAILVAAVPIPLWDPVRLAEEMSVLDLISKGRVLYALGIGHRREEYDHFGVSMATRGRVADQIMAVLGGLVRGEAVEFPGPPIRVTPACASASGPGDDDCRRQPGRRSTRCQARSWVHFADRLPGPQGSLRVAMPCIRARARGRAVPVPDTPTVVFVADDVDEAWSMLGPHLLHDAVTAASYRPHDDSVASITRADNVAALRAAEGPYRVFTLSEATDYIRGGRPLPLHPLCGGIPPDVAWRHLELAGTASARAQQ